jgi:hypothetical protein
MAEASERIGGGSSQCLAHFFPAASGIAIHLRNILKGMIRRLRQNGVIGKLENRSPLSDGPIKLRWFVSHICSPSVDAKNLASQKLSGSHAENFLLSLQGPSP